MPPPTHRHGMSPGIFACTSLAVIRAGRQREDVEEQGRYSAAHSRKWKDITAPLGIGLLSSKHFLIRSNFSCSVCVFVYMYLYETQTDRERQTEQQIEDRQTRTLF